MLKDARKRLRVLVKLIEKSKAGVYTDSANMVGNSTTMALAGVGTGMNRAKFKDKARQLLPPIFKSHPEKPALAPLSNGYPGANPPHWAPHAGLTLMEITPAASACLSWKSPLPCYCG